MQPEEKVVSMDEYRDPKGNDPKDNGTPPLHGQNVKTSRGVSRTALVLAILALLAAGALFFKTNQNLASLSKDVTGITAKIGLMDARMAELENLPAKSKQMVTAAMIQEMAQKAAYLSTQVDKEQAAKLLQAMELLQQAQPAQ